jgi:DsbC/DsbD-like thiol-disulfide interchange protein
MVRNIGMRFRRFQFWFVFGIYLSAAAIAQGPIQPVQWMGSVTTKAPVEPGTKTTIDLTADILEGWHVYGLAQPSGGPTSLHVALDDNEAVQAAGAVSGTAPIRKHDSSFDLETQVYTRSFILHVPVQVKQHPAAGKQSVSVSVRFQACSDRICLPPRTIHVPVSIEIRQGI